MKKVLKKHQKTVKKLVLKHLISTYLYRHQYIGLSQRLVDGAFAGVIWCTDGSLLDGSAGGGLNEELRTSG
jgi:hypothetical protein